MPEDQQQAGQQGPAGILVDGVQFTYPGCATAFIRDCGMNLPRGSRCLLIGANGAGKTTLLQIVAGKYMVGKEQVQVLGRPPFHDMVRLQFAS